VQRPIFVKSLSIISQALNHCYSPLGPNFTTAVGVV
jgi:hypothetical protein